MNLKLKRILAVVGIILLCILCFLTLNVKKEKEEIVSSITGDIIYSYVNNTPLTEDFFKESIATLKKKNLLSELYFVNGYNDYLNGNEDGAIDNFQLSLTQNSMNSLPKAYSAKLIAKIYFLRNDDINGIKYTNLAINQLSSEEINKHYELAWDLIRPLAHMNNGRDTLIEIIQNILSNNKHLSKEAALFYQSKLGTLYTLVNQFADASAYTVESVYLAKELEDPYLEATNLINLAIIFKDIRGTSSATTLLKNVLDINIPDKYLDASTKCYALINLSEIYLNSYDYLECELTLKQLSKYDYLLEPNEFNDINIYKNIINGVIYANYYKNLEKAEEFLNTANTLLSSTNEFIYADNDVAYLTAYANFQSIKGNKTQSLELYNQALALCEERNILYVQELILKQLISIYSEVNNHEKKDIYTTRLLSLIDFEKDIRFKDYSLYILDNIELKKEQQNDKNNEKVFYIFILILTVVLSTLGTTIFFKFKKLKYANTHDGLTNVYNRRYFDKKYRHLMLKGNFSIIMIDIDNFKSINDTYGHEFGDTVLSNVCNVIGKSLDYNCDLFRYGGEELTVLCLKHNLESAVIIAEKIRFSVENMIWKEPIKVTISLGVAFTEVPHRNILEFADSNLYKAKKTGKNKVAY